MVVASTAYGCILYHLWLQVLALPLSLHSGEAVAVLQLFEKRGVHTYMDMHTHMHMHMHIHAHAHAHIHAHTGALFSAHDGEQLSTIATEAAVTLRHSELYSQLQLAEAQYAQLAGNPNPNPSPSPNPNPNPNPNPSPKPSPSPNPNPKLAGLVGNATQEAVAQRLRRAGAQLAERIPCGQLMLLQLDTLAGTLQTLTLPLPLPLTPTLPLLLTITLTLPLAPILTPSRHAADRLRYRRAYRRPRQASTKSNPDPNPHPNPQPNPHPKPNSNLNPTPNPQPPNP